VRRYPARSNLLLRNDRYARRGPGERSKDDQLCGPVSLGDWRSILLCLHIEAASHDLENGLPCLARCLGNRFD
jgi:hypothetical protein